MKKSKTYSKICEKCKSQYEAKRDTSRWCDRCRTCKARGCKTTFNTLEDRKSPYCRPCNTAKNRADNFHLTKFGKWLLSQLDRAGTLEVLPRNIDNLNALLGLYKDMSTLQPYESGLPVKEYSFSLCHLTPAISKHAERLGLLVAHNLLIAPQVVNVKLGNTDYGYDFSINVCDLDSKYSFKRKSHKANFKKLQNKLYRYFPAVEKWVLEQKLPYKKDDATYVPSDYARTRGNYYFQLLREITRLEQYPEHNQNKLLFRSLTKSLQDRCPDFRKFGHRVSRQYEQFLADEVSNHLLRRDFSQIQLEPKTTVIDLQYAGPYSAKTYDKKAS